MSYISKCKSFQQFEKHLTQLESQLDETDKKGLPFDMIMKNKLNVIKGFYAQGYWPNIQYWQGKFNDFILKQDIQGVDSAHRKLDYLIGKQWNLENRFNKMKTYEI